MILNTACWGMLDVGEDGFTEHVILKINGKQRNIWLDILEDVLPSMPVEKVICLLDSVSACDAIIQKTLTQGEGKNAFVDEFIEYHLEEFDAETLESLNIIPPTRLVCAENLILRNVTIWIAAPAPGTLKMTLDYGLPEEVSDELLVFNFDEHGALLDITWES